MGIETEKFFTAKTQALSLSEVQSEKLVTWIRFFVGFGYLVLSLLGLLLGRVVVGAFIVGVVAIAVLFLCNGYYLLRTRKSPPGILAVYALLFLDVTVITVVILVYTSSSANPLIPSTALFCTYFITIIFTALHYRASLVIFGCVLSIAEFSIFFFINLMQTTTGQREFLYFYFIQTAVLMLVSAIGAVITRNNSRIINRIVTSEMRYQHLVHRLPEMLFTIDRHGGILWANSASQAILGIPAKTVCGRNIKDFVVEPTAVKLDAGQFRSVIEIRDFDGRMRFVDCSLQPISEETGIAAFEGIMADVTDREMAITQREEMVGRLFQYQKMESLGSLASGMAHDFNHTLQTIADVTGMVRKETAEDATRQKMDSLAESLADARFLVNELLALGRKAPLDYRPVNLTEFCSRLPSSLQTALGGNPIDVKINVPADPLYIMGDADYLKRIFHNLAINARDVMPGGGTITISCDTAKNADGDMVVIRFSDTGSGIPQGVLGRIFDPFFTTKKAGRGTGLGLALVQRIVSLHNGRVAVEKTGPAGTTFHIEIPRAENVCIDDDTKFILSHRINTRLLLVDDDRKIREVLTFFLKEYGYEISEAGTQESAQTELEKVRDTCAILIMDWKVGSDDPHKIITALREVRKDLIVIVVSGYPADAKSIKSMNITRWFTKPYDKVQLDLEIQRALHRPVSA